MKKLSRFLVVALAVVMLMGAFSCVWAQGSNFKIYHLTKNKLSMADGAFTASSAWTLDKSDYVLTLYTQPVEKMGKKADVTNVKVIGANGTEYPAALSDWKPAAFDPSHQVPGKMVVRVPASELKNAIFGGFGHFHVKFNTNLREAFGIFGGIFPEAMTDPEARFTLYQ